MKQGSPGATDKSARSTVIHASYNINTNINLFKITNMIPNPHNTGDPSAGVSQTSRPKAAKSQ
jgi:hypothetical protein